MEAKPAAAIAETLAFQIVEGEIQNLFYRRGRVAAHVLATSGHAVRLLFAFPAGNTGIGLWFDDLPESVEIAVDGQLEPVELDDGMRGVSGRVTSSAPRLELRGAVLGSVRTLRRYRRTGALPAELAADVDPGPPLTLRRTRRDGGRRVEISFVPEDGTTASVDAGGRVVLSADSGGVRFRATALADDPPLTPLSTDELFTEAAAPSRREREALAFLAYREKLLAGAWRFLTYFGRDTLLSVRLLMPALRPEVIEAALGSVLERLADDGRVAHEEDVGEWPVLHGFGDRWLDYKMVDDDFLLAPVVDAYLTAAGPAAAGFLARRAPDGRGYAELLRRNLELVENRARPYAEHQDPEQMVKLLDGHLVGEWRDSAEGLGLGRVPYDVNAALVPAALAAGARLWRRMGEPEAAARMAALETPWHGAAAHFRLQFSADEARARVAAYAIEVGIDATEALAAITGPVAFPALALDEVGRPLAVQHSDEGFALLFTDPTPQQLEEAATRIVSPFPAGLRTPVGILVANPAFADPETRALFTPRHYHGTVVWSWQQALIAAGLRRQLERTDLPEHTRAVLRDAEATLWRLIRTLREVSTSELWSFQTRDGRIEMLPFGQHPHGAPHDPSSRVAAGHADESNAVQLWSTVYLAVRPP